MNGNFFWECRPVLKNGVWAIICTWELFQLKKYTKKYGNVLELPTKSNGSMWWLEIVWYSFNNTGGLVNKDIQCKAKKIDKKINRAYPHASLPLCFQGIFQFLDTHLEL